jgi:hypothetical protein
MAPRTNPKTLAEDRWNSGTERKRKNTVFVLVLILLSFFLIDILFVQRYLFFYVYEEWLINYSQGFIRRGLPGEVLIFFSNHFGLDPFKQIQSFSYLLLILFAATYLIRVRQSLRVLDLGSLIIILLLPSLLFFPLHDPSAIGRKEFLFFIGLFVHLFILDKAVKELTLQRIWQSGPITNIIIDRYCCRLFIWYNLLSVPAALAHESIIFMSLPLNIMITLSLIGLRFPNNQLIIRTLLIYLPTISTTLLCFLFRGDDSVALGICQSWQENIAQYTTVNCDPDYLPAIESISKTGTINISNNVPWSLQYVGLPVRYYIIENWKNNISNHNGLILLKWIFAFLLCFLILIVTSFRVLLRTIDKLKAEYLDQNSSNVYLKHSFERKSAHLASGFIVKYALVPYAFSFVMYFITQDWGRWFFVTSSSYAICFLHQHLVSLEVLGSSCGEWSRWNSKLARLLLPLHSACFRVENVFSKFHFLRRISSILCLLLVLFALFFLRIPHHQTHWRPFFVPWIIDLPR